MYIIGAVIEKDCSKVALYDKEYKSLFEKKGAPKDLSELCVDMISEMNIKTSDIDYIGVAVDACF